MSHLTCSHCHIGSRPRSVISPHPIHACALGCFLSVFFLLSFYLLSKSFFHLFLTPAIVPDENSMNDPLCNSAIGSMVSLDYVTPDTDPGGPPPLLQLFCVIPSPTRLDFHSLVLYSNVARFRGCGGFSRLTCVTRQLRCTFADPLWCSVTSQTVRQCSVWTVTRVTVQLVQSCVQFFDFFIFLENAIATSCWAEMLLHDVRVAHCRVCCGTF